MTVESTPRVVHERPRTKSPNGAPLAIPLDHSLLPAQLRAPIAIIVACAMTLAVQGYQFGQSNHSVYLLDGLHQLHPQLLKNDWFVTQTFQFHALFGVITRVFMKFNILEQAFFAGYLLLVWVLHLSWWRIVRALGGSVHSYVASELVFQLLAAGVGLGSFLFLQDSSFLPSNISAVAMLFGIACWVERRWVLAGVGFGTAGAFHLNFAPVAPMIWVALVLFVWNQVTRTDRRWIVLGSALAIVPALANAGFAMPSLASRGPQLPLSEFVDLYVRLRHPHHYDPASWPAWMWLAFLLPIPPTLIMWRRLMQRGRNIPAIRTIAVVFALVSVLQVIALVGAGFFWLNERLIQASLYRFSIFVKLFCCIGCGMLIMYYARTLTIRRWLARAAVAVAVLMVLVCVKRGPYFGLFWVVRDDPKLWQACDWVREHTDRDDVFIVPPQEQDFRWRAQRAIVVNFKAVPNSDLVEWRKRLQELLDAPDLNAMYSPSGLTTFDLMERRYLSLPPIHFFRLADKYGARYVLTSARWPAEYEQLRIDLDGNTRWFLYMWQVAQRKRHDHHHARLRPRRYGRQSLRRLLRQNDLVQHPQLSGDGEPVGKSAL
jgi:hypothetical protein